MSKATSAAHQGAHGNNPRPEPTEAQKRAGNYKKGRVTLYGIPIVIEQPKESYRSGVDRDGNAWRCRMCAHYGYFAGTKGADGDEVDVFIGPMEESADKVYVINQFFNGKFDEHKVMLGFMDEESARTAYLNSYDRGWQGLENLVPLSINRFKLWLSATNNKHEPVSEKHMNRVYWDDASPRGTSISRLLYQIREHDHDHGLLMDAVDMSEVLADAEDDAIYDALVTTKADVEHKMGALQKVMSRAGNELSVGEVQVSEPFTKAGSANIAAVFSLSDGQTVTIYMHNPDTTPGKIAPDDDLISWKWLLNKKDITIVVAPESGNDLNVREVGRRIMALAEANSAKFKKQNEKKAAEAEAIGQLEADLKEWESKVETLRQQVAEAEAAKSARESAEAEQAEARLGLKPFEYHGSDDTMVTGYSKFLPGERVQQVDELRYKGTVVTPIGTPDQHGVVSEVLVELDQGGELRIPSGSLEALVDVANEIEDERREIETEEHQEEETHTGISVTGSELGEFEDTPEGKKAFQSAVKDFLATLRGEWIDVPALGAKVEIRMRSIKEMRRYLGNPVKLKLMSAIRQIIATSHSPVEEANFKKAKKPQVVRYFHLSNKVTVDGEEVSVRVVIEEDQQGLLHYDVIVEADKAKTALMDSAVDTEAMTPAHKAGITSDENDITGDNGSQEEPDDADFDSSDGTDLVLNLFIDGEDNEVEDDLNERAGFENSAGDTSAKRPTGEEIAKKLEQLGWVISKGESEEGEAWVASYGPKLGTVVNIDQDQSGGLELDGDEPPSNMNAGEIASWIHEQWAVAGFTYDPDEQREKFDLPVDGDDENYRSDAFVASLSVLAKMVQDNGGLLNLGNFDFSLSPGLFDDAFSGGSLLGKTDIIAQIGNAKTREGVGRVSIDFRGAVTLYRKLSGADTIVKESRDWIEIQDALRELISDSQRETDQANTEYQDKPVSEQGIINAMTAGYTDLAEKARKAQKMFTGVMTMTDYGEALKVAQEASNLLTEHKLGKDLERLARDLPEYKKIVDARAKIAREREVISNERHKISLMRKSKKRERLLDENEEKLNQLYRAIEEETGIDGYAIERTLLEDGIVKKLKSDIADQTGYLKEVLAARDLEQKSSDRLLEIHDSSMKEKATRLAESVSADNFESFIYGLDEALEHTFNFISYEELPAYELKVEDLVRMSKDPKWSEFITSTKGFGVNAGTNYISLDYSSGFQGKLVQDKEGRLRQGVTIKANSSTQNTEVAYAYVNQKWNWQQDAILIKGMTAKEKEFSALVVKKLLPKYGTTTVRLDDMASLVSTIRGDGPGPLSLLEPIYEAGLSDVNPENFAGKPSDYIRTAYQGWISSSSGAPDPVEPDALEKFTMDKAVFEALKDHGWTDGRFGGVEKTFAGVAVAGTVSDGSRTLSITEREQQFVAYLGDDIIQSVPVPPLKPQPTDNPVVIDIATSLNAAVEEYVEDKRISQQPVPVPESDPDHDYLQSIIDGTVDDILSPQVGQKMEEIYERTQQNPDIQALLEKALGSYQQAVVQASSQLQ